MKKLLTILLLAFAFIANATTYYISPTGNDLTGDGSIGNPWKTLVKATTAVTTAGSIIHVNTGTYLETAQIILAPGVSIEGTDSTNTVIRSTLTADYTEMINMRSPAEGVNGNQHISTIKIDGQSTTFALIRIGGRSNVTIHDCSFVNAKIYGVTFAAHDADANDPGYPTLGYCTGNTFYNNKTYNCGNWWSANGNGYGGLQFGGQSGFLIHHNTFIQANTCYNNGWPIKYWQGGYSIGTKIYKNTITAAPQCFTLGDLNWDFAIEIFNCTGMEIDSNIINNGCVDFNNSSATSFGTGIGGRFVGGYGYSLWVHDNTFAMATVNSHVQTGITLEYNDDSVTIERNTFDKYNIGVLYTPRPGSVISNITIRNNLFTGVSIGDGSEGYFIDHGVYSGTNVSFKNMYIYNNTFLASGSIPPYHGILLPNSTSGGTLKNFYIKNNIIKGVINAPFEVREGTVAIDSLDIEYNDLYGNGNSNLPNYFITPTHITFSHNLNVNPSFGVGFGLIAGTSLVDAGINVGLPFTGTAPDINWTEITSAPPPVVCGTWDSAYTGNFFTLSLDKKTITCSNPTTTTSALSTVGTNAAKKAYSFIIKGLPSTNWFFGIGMANRSITLTDQQFSNVNAYMIQGDGTWRHNGFPGGGMSAFNIGDTITLGVDFSGSTGSMTVYKNRVSAGTPFTGIDKSVAWYPCVTNANTGSTTDWKVQLLTDSSGFIPTGYTSLCAATIDSTPPVPNAGPDQSITLPTNSVTLAGSASPGGGSIISHFWHKVSGSGTITDSTSYTSTVTSLTVGTTIIQLRVTDSYSQTVYDTMQIVVNPADSTPPVPHAGPDQTITIPVNSVTLAGSVTPGAVSVVSHFWHKLSGPGTITDSTSYTSTVTGLTAGTTLIQIRVTDAYSQVRYDTMQITINPDVTPPTVVSTNPVNTATGVANTTTTFIVTFDNTMDGTTLTAGNIYLTGVTGVVTHGTNYATITISTTLTYSTTYTLNVSTGVKDAAGNNMAADYTGIFTTVASPGSIEYRNIYIIHH